MTYRTLDLKSNEYRGLEGGDRFEPVEANPMIGRRGAYRYLVRPSELLLELRPSRRSSTPGTTTSALMLPFVRTVAELRAVKGCVARAGLLDRPASSCGRWRRCPATALLAAARSPREVDGVSIGSNDLAQLVLGVDRDSARARATLPPRRRRGRSRRMRPDHRGRARRGRPVSICGDAPSRDPELVATLVRLGIDAISVVPDAYEETVRAVESALATA